ncbi:MAG: hypothetical protein C0518_05520 [Opitutus sp.]|nr:hypothetical protein [Opitutus sp.]
MKVRSDSKLKTLPDALQEAFFQKLRSTSVAKALAWLAEKHDVQSSPAAASEFFSWYPRSCTLRMAASTSTQLEQTLRKMPELKVTAEQAAKVAQINFEIQAAQDRDPALFTALRRGELESQRLQLEREKFEHTKKTDAEKGLEALHAEIKGNAEALKHFEAMKAALRKGGN